MKILSNQDVLSRFFGSLQVGEIFGYSQAFKKDWVIDQAAGLGVKVSAPAKTTTEHKQYGDYVLKVRAVYPALTRVTLSLNEASYTTEIAKRPRACQGGHAIPQGSVCMIETLPDTLPDGRHISKKRNYCVTCGRAKLQAISNRVQSFTINLRE